MIELLAPAGDLEKLKIAYLYGADACFIGGQEYSLRARASNFSLAQIKEGAEFAHSLGKKLYVTTNIIPHNENLAGFITYLKALEKTKIDGIIVASPYLVETAKKHTKLPIHISTQQSVLNNYHLKYWEEKGAERIVLGRELSLLEIAEIKKHAKAEIEAFIHGGMCSSYSGRCTLSNTFTLRDANRGGCAHSCRWDYEIYDGENKISHNIPFSMGSKDLQTVSLIPKLIEIGVNSLKIEGRMKSIHYIATVVSVYRQVIDEYLKTGQIADFSIYEQEIEKAENRETASGFLVHEPTAAGQLYQNSIRKPSQTFVGIVVGKDQGYTVVEQRNHFKVGDTLEIFGPNKKAKKFVVENIYTEDLSLLDAARHPKELVLLKIPFTSDNYDMLRLVNE
ncbi:MAG: U32 family peptidase [Acholeplasmataceae bacterium]|jgi:putative protease|nr:U32 family peptidase [Acholeplasmataceae bacterium]